MTDGARDDIADEAPGALTLTGWPPKPWTKVAHVAAAGAFLLISLSAIAVATGYPLIGRTGIGPGFFPFVTGVVLAAASLSWLLQLLLGIADVSTPLYRARDEARRIGLILVLIVAYLLTLPVLGFQIATAAFTWLFAVAFGGQRPIVAVAIAVVASVGLHLLFVVLLQVPLPELALALP